MNKIHLVVISFLFSFVFSGCGTAIKLQDYTVSSLNKAKNIPSKDVMMNTSLPKIIIMDIDNNNLLVANNAELGKSMATNINTNLSKANSVNILKRVGNSGYKKMLSQEIKVAELGKEIGADVGQANYILTGQISNASYDYAFKEGYYYEVKTKEGSKTLYQPPVINYKACAIGNIKIFSLPDLSEAKSIEFNECSSDSQEARSPKDARLKNDGLVRSAGEEAADTAKYDLKNFFVKKGYIYEMKKDDDKVIVKTTLGSKFGAKEGEEVYLYAVEDLYNSLTDSTKKIETKIGKGVVSDQVNNDFSWIIVKEMYNGKSINAGDYIKIQYTEGWLSKVKKIAK
jgi:hypothetical protein